MNEAKQCCLATSAGAHETDEFARINCEVNSSNCLRLDLPILATEDFAQSPSFKFTNSVRIIHRTSPKVNEMVIGGTISLPVPPITVLLARLARSCQFWRAHDLSVQSPPILQTEQPLRDRRPQRIG